jgi:hypothetical protein
MVLAPQVDSVLVITVIQEQIVPLIFLAQEGSTSAVPTANVKLAAIVRASQAIVVKIVQMELRRAPKTAVVMVSARRHRSANATQDGLVRVVIRSSSSWRRSVLIIAVAMGSVSWVLAADARKAGLERHAQPAAQSGRQ